jgi:hypothetical protein
MANSPSPWSVKGVEPEAREAAKIAARKAGLTVGAWLTQMIRQSASDQLRSGGNQAPPPEATGYDRPHSQHYPSQHPGQANKIQTSGNQFRGKHFPGNRRLGIFPQNRDRWRRRPRDHPFCATQSSASSSRQSLAAEAGCLSNYPHRTKRRRHRKLPMPHQPSRRHPHRLQRHQPRHRQHSHLTDCPRTCLTRPGKSS